MKIEKIEWKAQGILDPTKKRIILQLLKEPLTKKQLAKKTGINEKYISYKTTSLENNRIIDGELKKSKEPGIKKEKTYQINPETLTKIKNNIQQYLDQMVIT